MDSIEVLTPYGICEDKVAICEFIDTTNHKEQPIRPKRN